MFGKVYKISAVWDAEASVWVASSDDVPGLATESEDLDHLAHKLRFMVPELLELNGVAATGTRAVPFRLDVLMPCERPLGP